MDQAQNDKQKAVAGGARGIDQAAKQFAEGPPPNEGLILRCVFQYLYQSGARDPHAVRRSRGHTVDLMLRKLRRVMKETYDRQLAPDEALRLQRSFGTMCTRAKKVFLDLLLDTDEVLLAAGLRLEATGALVEVSPPPLLFGRLARDAQSRSSDGRRKKGSGGARTVSLDGLMRDLDTLVAIDSDSLWDRLIPWLEEQNFQVEDLEAVG